MSEKEKLESIVEQGRRRFAEDIARAVLCTEEIDEDTGRFRITLDFDNRDAAEYAAISIGATYRAMRELAKLK